VEVTTQEVFSCDSCKRKVFSLSAIDGARLCDRCAVMSAQIDQDLIGVCADDPVTCDGCKRLVDFDARIAIITRACGGVIVCDDCKPVAIEGEAACV